MPFEHLIFAAINLLPEDGVFSVVIPYKEETNFVDLALKGGLHPKRILHVKGNPNTEIKRSLLEFSFKESTVEISELIIETARHQYTEDYIKLTKDFYLKM